MKLIIFMHLSAFSNIYIEKTAKINSTFAQHDLLERLKKSRKRLTYYVAYDIICPS